jgi:hypothetical protein
MRYALIENATSLVVNVIEYDPSSTYEVDPSMTLVEAPTANIGDTYDSVNGTFVAPVSEEDTSTPVEAV